jgi:hypothetical protein
MGMGDYFKGKSARSVKMNIHTQLVSRLRMAGVEPPLSLHAFMARTGTDLLYFSKWKIGLELMKSRQLSICESVKLLVQY